MKEGTGAEVYRQSVGKGSFKSSPGCQNNISIGPTVPKSVE
jgi:hypothetical protein